MSRQKLSESLFPTVSFCGGYVICFQNGDELGVCAAIVEFDHPVTLVGGGESLPGDLDLAMGFAPAAVAADGGAALCLAAGVMPEAVFGDFDSLAASDQADLPVERLHPMDEQESTDFDKCLRSVAAPLAIGVGFTGARQDHHLAACNTLVRHPHRPCILIGREDIVFLAPPRVQLELAEGSVLSLFPMAPVTGISEGLRWPIAGLHFSPDGRIGTSNIVTGQVDMAFDAAAMLVILPRAALAEAVRALAAPGGRWPSP